MIPAGSGSALADALAWVLPLAKGYAAAHPVGANQAKVNDAERILRDFLDCDGTCECGSGSKENCEASPNDDCGIIRASPTPNALADALEKAAEERMGRLCEALRLLAAAERRRADHDARKRESWGLVRQAANDALRHNDIHPGVYNVIAALAALEAEGGE